MSIALYIERAEMFSTLLKVEAGKLSCPPREGSELLYVAELEAIQKERRGVRNELESLTPATMQEVRNAGGDPSKVRKATLAAWHHINRFDEVWLDARCELEAILIAPPNRPDETFSEFHPKYPPEKVTRREIAKLWLAAHPEETRDIGQLMKKIDYDRRLSNPKR